MWNIPERMQARLLILSALASGFWKTEKVAAEAAAVAAAAFSPNQIVPHVEICVEAVYLEAVGSPYNFPVALLRPQLLSTSWIKHPDCVPILPALANLFDANCGLAMQVSLVLIGIHSLHGSLMLSHVVISFSSN
jgi:hypothetical protein